MLKPLLLFLILSSSVAFGQDYRYRKVETKSKGENSFSFSQHQCKERQGTISVRGNYIQIDDKRYNIKKAKARNIYKTDHGFLKLFYEENTLFMVSALEYNTSTLYFLNP